MAKKKTTAGRPKGRDVSQALIGQFRVPQIVKDALSQFRDNQGVAPSESAVVRELLTRALKAEGLL